MPQAIALWAADAVATALFGATSEAVLDAAVIATYATVAVGTTLAIGAVANALLAPGTPDPAAVTTPVRQAIPPRRSGTGVAKIAGYYMLFDTAVADGTSTDVLALHDGQINRFRTYYLNDDRVGLSPDGWVITIDRPDGRYSSDGTMPSDKVQILTRLGEPTETAYTYVAGSALPNWSASHRGDGIASLCLGCRTPKLTYYETIYPNGLPQPSVVAELQLLLDPRTGETAWTENAFLGLLGYLTTANGGMGLDYTRRIVPALDTWIAAANDCDLPTPKKNLASQLSTKAQTGHSTLSLIDVSGLNVGMTITLGAGLGTEEIVTVESITGLNVGLAADLAYDHDVDEIVAWVTDPDSPATEPRYTAGGVYDHTTAPTDVIQKYLQCCDGWVCPRGDGALVAKSGRYYAPTVTITDLHIVTYDFQHYVEDELATNVWKLQYSSPVHAYNVVDTADWRDEDDIDARGKERSDTLTLDWVHSNGQARRLAKRYAARALAAVRGTVTTNLYGMNALGERFIGFQISEAEALADIVVEVTKVTIDIMNLQLTFEWVLADPDIDDWVPAIEEGDAPGGVDLLSLGILPKPVITAVDPDFSSVANGAGGVRLKVTIADLDRDDLTFAIRWRDAPDGPWAESQFDDVDDTSGVVLSTGFVPTGIDLNVMAAYATGDGRYSGWGGDADGDPFLINTSTDAVAPDAITDLAVQSWTNVLSLTCAPSARARTYRWDIYKADGTTLIASHTTTTPSFGYTAQQALGEGAQRSYVIKATAVNAAGDSASLNVSPAKPAPAALAGVSATGGATTGTVDATPPATAPAGYLAIYSATSGFDPSTYGTPVTSGALPIYIYGLPAFEFFVRVSAVDEWSTNPALLNMSDEQSFSITTGDGASPSGGGSAGHAGGWKSGGGMIATP